MRKTVATLLIVAAAMFAVSAPVEAANLSSYEGFSSFVLDGALNGDRS